jgi:hypothetical protein
MQDSSEERYVSEVSGVVKIILTKVSCGGLSDTAHLGSAIPFTQPCAEAFRYCELIPMYRIKRALSWREQQRCKTSIVNYVIMKMI